MSLTLEEIHAEALNLPHESRAELVERLMATLVESPDPEVEQAWFQEAERRRQQLLDGSVQGIPAEEVFARLSAKYRR
jgi:putative addiction module component (TIGR02574 family)